MNRLQFNVGGFALISHSFIIKIVPSEYDDFPHHDDSMQQQFHCDNVLELSSYNVRYRYDVINDLLSEKTVRFMSLSIYRC